MKFDIIGLCETWSSTPGEFKDLLPGYICYDCVNGQTSKFGRVSGGIAVFVKHDIDIGIKRLWHNYKNAVFILLQHDILHLQRDIHCSTTEQWKLME